MLQIHFLYQFSLQFFLEIFSCVLSANKHLDGVTNYANRLSIISTDLFQVSVMYLYTVYVCVCVELV